MSKIIRVLTAANTTFWSLCKNLRTWVLEKLSGLRESWPATSYSVSKRLRETASKFVSIVVDIFKPYNQFCLYIKNIFILFFKDPIKYFTLFCVIYVKYFTIFCTNPKEFFKITFTNLLSLLKSIYYYINYILDQFLDFFLKCLFRFISLQLVIIFIIYSIGYMIFYHYSFEHKNSLSKRFSIKLLNCFYKIFSFFYESSVAIRNANICCFYIKKCSKLLWYSFLDIPKFIFTNSVQIIIFSIEFSYNIFLAIMVGWFKGSPNTDFFVGLRPQLVWDYFCSTIVSIRDAVVNFLYTVFLKYAYQVVLNRQLFKKIFKYYASFLIKLFISFYIFLNFIYKPILVAFPLQLLLWDLNNISDYLIFFLSFLNINNILILFYAFHATNSSIFESDLFFLELGLNWVKFFVLFDFGLSMTTIPCFLKELFFQALLYLSLLDCSGLFMSNQIPYFFFFFFFFFFTLFFIFFFFFFFVFFFFFYSILLYCNFKLVFLQLFRYLWYF